MTSSSSSRSTRGMITVSARRARRSWPTPRRSARPMPPASERPPIVELAPAMANVAWSRELVTQSLEPLFVYLSDEGARNLRPIHAATLRFGWPPDQLPGDVVANAAHRYGLRPLLVHSTSW